MLKTIIIFISIAWFLPGFSVATEKKPFVIVASIKPLQLIAQALTQNVVNIDVIVPENQSPHTYQLRPSSRKRLMNANMVIWMGPELESFLTKLMNHLSAKHRSIAILDAIEFPLQPLSSQHHGHDSESNRDPHVWLSPKGGLAIAKVILEALCAEDPSNSTHYRQNFKSFSDKIALIDAQIVNKLAKIKQPSYIVYHNAYGYFETEFGFSHQAVIVENVEGLVGLHHWIELQKLIANKQPHCIFIEPEFQRTFFKSFEQLETVKVVSLDPLANTIKVGPTGYVDFLSQLADDFHKCVSHAKSNDAL